MNLNLILCTIEDFDRDRALNLHLVIVSKFYDTFSSAYKKHSNALDHIWNYDKTCL